MFDRKTYHKAYYETHKEEGKAYRKAHKKEIAIRNKIYYETHKKELTSYKKAHRLQKKYGITLEEKRTMYRQQSGCCAICGKELTDSRDCNVDHCHVTGKIRGLLCRKCNTMLGSVSDDPKILQSAIDYVRKNL